MQLPVPQAGTKDREIKRQEHREHSRIKAVREKSVFLSDTGNRDRSYLCGFRGGWTDTRDADTDTAWNTGAYGSGHLSF